jgi:peroxiredoxin
MSRPALAAALAVVAVAALVAIVDAEGPADALRLTRLRGSEPAAAFSVARPEGGTIAVADLRGKVVLLNFWATWCEPCLEEMPALERLSRAYGERGLVVLGLSVDREGPAAVRTFVRRHGLSFLVALDPQQGVARAYRVWGLPATVVLSRKGLPLFSAQGARDWDSPAGHAFFEDLLDQGS